MSGLLDGMHVVVTGASGALGSVIASRFFDEGAVCHLPVRAADAARAALPDHPRIRVEPGVELTDDAAVASYFAALPKLWGSVHAAGGFAMAPLERTGRGALQAMLDINIVTALLCCRGAAMAMRKHGRGGRIVNVAARAALEPKAGARMAAYAASKAAVASLTVALAEELKGDGIMVNAIAPSVLDTPANRKAMPNADFSKWVTLGAAAEIVLHLVSPGNTAATGAVVPLNART